VSGNKKIMYPDSLLNFRTVHLVTLNGILKLADDTNDMHETESDSATGTSESDQYGRKSLVWKSGVTCKVQLGLWLELGWGLW